MPFLVRGLCTHSVGLSDQLRALRQYSRDQLVKVSPGHFRSTGSDGGEAQILALALPVDGYGGAAIGALYLLLAQVAIGSCSFAGYEAAQPLSDAPFTLDDDNVRHRVDLTVVNQ